MSILFAKIESLCKSHNINITEMCRQCNIPRSTLTDLKFGRVKTISAFNLQKIATLFGITTDYFFDDDINVGNTINGNNNIIGNGNTVGLSAQEQALVDLFRKLDVIQQSQLIAYAAELGEE